MKWLRDLDDYERETFFRVATIIVLLIFVAVMVFVALSLQQNTGTQLEPPDYHMNPLPYTSLSTPERLNLFPLVAILAGFMLIMYSVKGA